MIRCSLLIFRFNFFFFSHLFLLSRAKLLHIWFAPYLFAPPSSLASLHTLDEMWTIKRCDLFFYSVLRYVWEVVYLALDMRVNSLIIYFKNFDFGFICMCIRLNWRRVFFCSYRFTFHDTNESLYWLASIQLVGVVSLVYRVKAYENPVF